MKKIWGGGSNKGWAESAPPGWNRVKVSANLGATTVAPVAPLVTSMNKHVGSNKRGAQILFLFV